MMIAAALTLTVSAQKRPVRKPAPKKPAPTVIPPLDVRAAREKVSVQLSNVDQFVDKLGPIAQGIEDTDAGARSRRLPPAAVDKNEANKRNVVQAIRNLRAGLATLESEFRTKETLRKYLPQIQGITDLAAQAEDSALAGKFVAAKEPLRSVAQKLTDTLGVMPK